MLDSLTAPMRQLAENAGVPAAAIDKALKSGKDGFGIDPATGRQCRCGRTPSTCCRSSRPPSPTRLPSPSAS